MQPTTELINNPNGILDPGRFVFYERMHTLAKGLYEREHFKILFRTTTRFLDTNDKAFKGLHPIEVMVTGLYHCHLLLHTAGKLPSTLSLERISEIALERPFADGKGIEIDKCRKAILLYPRNAIDNALIMHDALEAVIGNEGQRMSSVFTAVLVDNYLLENRVINGQELLCVQAAQAAAIRIFAPIQNQAQPPGRIYEQMLQLGMKIINSVKKKSRSVVAEPSTSHKKPRLATA